jgi:lipopolysaccharide/colanic/teichoic acid biosynthesis glycosyltransferase
VNGELFRCVKIRSLPPTTPAYLDKVALNGHCEPTGWSRILRRFHLDELPQFWHVVGGSMSLVGPRPMISSIIDEIPPDVRRVRHSIRPGITGPWQVSVDGSHSLLDCLDYDDTYVRCANPVLDLKLLVLTAAQALGYPKRTRDEVFAMMTSSPNVADDERSVIPLRHDTASADGGAAS